MIEVLKPNLYRALSGSIDTRVQHDRDLVDIKVPRENEALVTVYPANHDHIRSYTLPRVIKSLAGLASTLTFDLSRFSYLNEELIGAFIALGKQVEPVAKINLIGLSAAAAQSLNIKGLGSEFNVFPNLQAYFGFDPQDVLPEIDLAALSIGSKLRDRLSAAHAELDEVSCKMSKYLNEPEPSAEEIIRMSPQTQGLRIEIISNSISESSRVSYMLNSILGNIGAEEQVTLDVKGVKFIGADTIGAIKGLWERLTNAGRIFRLENLEQPVAKKLSMLRLLEALPHSLAPVV